MNFLLPKINIILYDKIDCSLTPSPLLDTGEKWRKTEGMQVAVSQSISRYLYDIKCRITHQEKVWDIYKKYTNPYEYIHSIIPHKKTSVSKYKPLSRSFFKMNEIIHTFHNLLPENSSPIKSFHLAEGPGGFIEALVSYRKSESDVVVGMTLLDDKNDNNIPAWKKSQYFLKENPHVFIETGKDHTGNILSIENFVYCKEKYESSMDFITADGGFDFSVDFNSQEITIARLLFAQIAFALCMQKKGGSFVVKIFDSFMQHTIDLIAILSSFYRHVHIFKPQTSRYANSEKYLICTGFLHDSNAPFYHILYDTFTKMMEDETTIPARFLSINIPCYFVQKIEEYNSIFGQKQIQNIHFTLSIIENKYKQDKIDDMIKVNVQRSIDWCTRHNIPYYSYNRNNIFLQG